MDLSYKFSNVADRYINYILKPRVNKQDREISYMEQWKSFFLVDDIREIKKKDVADARDRFFDHRKGNARGTGKVAVNRAMARLKHFFNVCADQWGLIPSSPATGLKPFEENKTKLAFLTTAEILRLLQECELSKNEDMYLFALMLLVSGARKSEILNLRFEEFNYEEMSAKLSHQKNGTPGKLYFNEEVMGLVKLKRRTEGLLFEHRYIDKGFKNAGRRAGVPAISPHGLRHTFASHFAMSNASSQEVKEALRVSSMAMVMRYAHLTPSHTHGKVAAVTNKWSKL